MGSEAERLAEVQRLCTALADRALDAQITGRTVPADQAVALAKAARLLQDHGVEWPPLLAQVLHELAASLEEPMPASAAEPLSNDLPGLTRFFSGSRKKDRT
jgi:hypothetical protein